MYLSETDIAKIGLKSYGQNLKISDKVTFYRPERITLGSNIQIDDYVVLANNITLHNNIHIAMGCYLLSSNNALIEMHDFTGISYQSAIITSSDDYYGFAMTNATIPAKFKKTTEKSVIIKKHALIGMGSKILPGVTIEEGSAIGAMSLVMRSTKPWKMYFGIPARVISDRSKELLKLEEQYLREKGE